MEGPGVVTRVYGALRSTRPPTLIGVGIRPPVGAAASVDLRRYVPPIEEQIGSSCVGHAIVDAHFVAVAATSKRISARGIYVAARARQRATLGAALPDTGCEPAEAFDALVAIGAFVEDGRDFDPAQLSTMSTWAELESAKRFQSSDLVPIAAGDVETIDRWLTQGAPVAFSMQVDASYESLTGTSVYAGPTGPSLGGHYQAIVGFTPTAYIVVNSWGTDWGDRGYSYIARDFVQNATEDLVAVRGGPVFQ